MEIIILQLILMMINGSLMFSLYKWKNYKVALFSAFVTGMCFHAVIVAISHI